ncbi:hypothetical protein Tco_1487858, partial [Tanacetum coccineum]
MSLQHLPLSPTTNPRLPGRLVAGDTNPGRHVARDKLKGKARQGYFPGRHVARESVPVNPGDMSPGIATRDMMVIANREISSKVKELVGPEGIAEDVMVAKIAREVLNKLLGNEEPHCYGA